MKATFKYNGRKITRYPYKITQDDIWFTLLYEDDEPESYHTYKIIDLIIEEGTGINKKDKYKKDHFYRLGNWFNDLESKYGHIEIKSASNYGTNRYSISFRKNNLPVHFDISEGWGDETIHFNGPTGNFTIDADLLKASLNQDLFPIFIKN